MKCLHFTGRTLLKSRDCLKMKKYQDFKFLCFQTSRKFLKWFVYILIFSTINYTYLLGQNVLLETEMNLDKVFPSDEAPHTYQARPLFDKDNVLWYTNNDQGLYEYDGEQVNYHPFQLEHKRNYAHVEWFEQMGNGVFVTESQVEILFCDPRDFKIYPFESEFIGQIKYYGYSKILPLDSNTVLIRNRDFFGVVKVLMGKDGLNFISTQIDTVLVNKLTEDVIFNFTKGLNNSIWGYGGDVLLELGVDSQRLKILSIDSLGFLKEKYEQPLVKSCVQQNEKYIFIAGACSKTLEAFLYRYNLKTGEYQSLPTFGLKVRPWVPKYDKLVIDSLGKLWVSYYGTKIIKYDYLEVSDSIEVIKAKKLNSSIKYPNQGLLSLVKNIFLDRSGGVWVQGIFGLTKHYDSNAKLKAHYLPDKNKEELIYHIHPNFSDSTLDIQTGKEYLRYTEDKSVRSLFDRTKFNKSFNHSINRIRMYSDSLIVYTTHLPNRIMRFTAKNGSFHSTTNPRLFEDYNLGIISFDDFKEVWAPSFRKDSPNCLLWYNPVSNTMKEFTVDSMSFGRYDYFIRIQRDKLFVFGLNGESFHEITLEIDNKNVSRIKSIEKIILPEFMRKFSKHDNSSLLFSSKAGRVYKFDIISKQFLEVLGLDIGDGMSSMYEDSDSTLWLQSKDARKLYYCNTLKQEYKVVNNLLDNNVKSGRFTGSLSHNLNGNTLIPGKGMFFEVLKPNHISTFNATPTIQAIKFNSKSNKTLQANKIQIEANKLLDYPHDIRQLKIEFTASHYKSVDENKYSYRLVGFDNSWSQESSAGEATYSYILPGKYTFQLKAANSDGVWSDEIAELKFRILAPWYWSLWSKSLYSLLGLLSLIIAYRFIQRRRDERLESVKIKEVDQLRTKLYTNITHEFRTPLTVIQGMAEDVFDNLPKTQQQRFGNKLQMILRNGDNLLGLVNQMLDLDKLEAGKFVLQYEQDDIIPYVHYLTDSFISMAELKDIQITFYSEVESLIMDFDPDNLRKIIFNLMSNAIKFTPKNGSVICHVTRVEDESDFCHIKIKDSGIGIPESELPKIFDRFHRVLEDGEDSGTGSGIGLALTKDLVGLMNGRINVQSSPGKGTEFTLKLPIINNAQISKTEFPESTRTLDRELKNEFLPEGLALELLPTALIVEDNRDVAAYVALCLRRRYNVIHAVDGKDGINKAFEEIPDIIISDVMMPKMNGFKLVETLKKDDRTSHVPIILLTAKSSLEDKLSGLKYGADSFLIKPFNKEELIIRMEQLIALRNKLWKKYSVLKKKGNSLEQTDDPQDKFITKTVKFVENNLENHDYGAESLAKDLNLSVSQSYRKIKFITGKSTAVFIRWVRLQHSLEMLKNTEKSISEVSYSCGFKDPSWFSRAFKEEFGYPPSAVVK